MSGGFIIQNPNRLEISGAHETQAEALNRVIAMLSESAIEVDPLSGRILPRGSAGKLGHEQIDAELRRFKVRCPDGRVGRLVVDCTHDFLREPRLALLTVPF